MSKLTRGPSSYDPGYIYIFRTGNNTNEIKIGLTRNVPQREKSLFNTSVALPFVLKVLWKVSSMKPAEEAAHAVMHENRINESRELFDVAQSHTITGDESRCYEFSNSSIGVILEWIEEGFYMADIQYERVYLNLD